MTTVQKTNNEEDWYEITIPNNNNYDNYKKWCDENLNAYKILVPLTSNYNGVYMPASFFSIMIENENDAAAFKLRWL